MAGYAAIGLVALAAGLILQPGGCNETAHLALVKSLHDGTPEIDRYAGETCDTAYIDEHYYAAKAPGLALVTRAVVRPASRRRPRGRAARVGRRRGSPRPCSSSPDHATWQVSLWGATLAALALLLVVRFAADRLVPGYGTAAAVLLGLGTLVLPFSTVFFAHVLSATLGMAALLPPAPSPPRRRRDSCACDRRRARGARSRRRVPARDRRRRARPLCRAVTPPALLARRGRRHRAAPRLQRLGVREPVRALVRERRDRAGRERARRDRRERRRPLRRHVPEPALGGGAPRLRQGVARPDAARDRRAGRARWRSAAATRGARRRCRLPCASPSSSTTARTSCPSGGGARPAVPRPRPAVPRARHRRRAAGARR